MPTQLHAVIEVPSNCSRYFEAREVAISQPRARVELILDQKYKFLRNQFYNPELIKHDKYYCTSNTFHLGESVAVLKIIPDIFFPNTQIIEIGCGQGEYVKELEKLGLLVVGYDPVCKTNKKNLFQTYFDPALHIENNSLQKLFVMRCVLPHIQHPFDFLNEIFSYAPDAKILMEFQRLEWILENAAWHQFSHDHVNYFSMDSFDLEFEVIYKGVFANQEWGWVLITQNKNNSANKSIIDYSGKILEVMSVRMLHLKAVSNLRKPIGIYGTAGKGIIFGDAINQTGITGIFGIDENNCYWGKFMEGSGIEILGPQAPLPSDSKIIVMNPRHYDQSLLSLGKSFEIINLFG